jgi:dTDP-4-dehydrorhamnose reductase
VKLLVLGANSQLGTALTRLLQSQALDFQALATSELNLLRQADVVKAVSRISPSQVINVATYSNLEKAESDPEAARECDIVNTQGVSTLAEVCKHLNLPLLHHSSSFVFDGQKVHPYTEEDETNPVCRYGQSKWYGERAIRAALPMHVILRTDWMFSRERKNFFQQHIDVCKRNKGRLEVMNHRFSPTPAPDVARVLLAIARQVDCAAEVWGTYHYCALQPMSQEHFVEQILHEAGRYDPELSACLPSLQITKLPVQKPYIPNTVLSTQRIFETFGIKPRSRAGELMALLQELYGVQPPEAPVTGSTAEVTGEEGAPETAARKRTAKPRGKAKGKPNARAGVRKAGSSQPARKGAVQKESPQS